MLKVDNYLSKNLKRMSNDTHVFLDKIEVLNVKDYIDNLEYSLTRYGIEKTIKEGFRIFDKINYRIDKKLCKNITAMEGLLKMLLDTIELLMQESKKYSKIAHKKIPSSMSNLRLYNPYIYSREIENVLSAE